MDAGNLDARSTALAAGTTASGTRCVYRKKIAVTRMNTGIRMAMAYSM